MTLSLPNEAGTALQRLRGAGFEAYVVGGCVRDALRGAMPADWDITTSALPEETAAVFADCKTVTTGIRHGTLTVILNGCPLEITTFRCDGTYSDHRHPDGVSFTRSIREDLARRDFTVNAMAYAPETGLVDPFGGREDLFAGIIRAVGKPQLRFSEDALRILRALRFSSVLDFSIEGETFSAAFSLRDTLSAVSAERCFSELKKLLCGPGAGRVISAAPEILSVLLPELLPQKGFDQRNPHHAYDLLTHTARTVDAAPAEPVLRLSALLHDIGKVDCFSLDDRGIGHAYGHAKRSAEIADAFLRAMRADNATRERVVLLVKEHDLRPEETERAVRRAMSRLTPEVYFQVLQLKRADNVGHGPDPKDRIGAIDRLADYSRALLEADAGCFTRKDLALNGSDLIRCGIPAGKPVGEALQLLLDAVLDENVKNTGDDLLQYLKNRRLL